MRVKLVTLGFTLLTLNAEAKVPRSSKLRYSISIVISLKKW